MIVRGLSMGCVTVIVLLSLYAVGHSAETKEIPLNHIWGYELPGTRDIRKLEPKLDVNDSSFKDLWGRSRINYIAKFLSTYAPNRGEWAGPAFVVVGTGKEALKNAHAVLKKRAMREQGRLLPKNVESSLVFYTYVTGWHPKINSVEKSPDLIRVKYQFIAPEEPSFGAKRFALIPIGKLSKGTVQVEIEQVPPVDYKGRPMPPKRDAQRFVCNSFSFDVY